MDIYIASSFRNLRRVRALRDDLMALGHTVHDWTRLAPPIPEHCTRKQRKALLDTDEKGDIFRFCRDACVSVDLVVYLGASGQDAGVEIGMAYASGTPVVGISGRKENPGLMLNGCAQWYPDKKSLLREIKSKKFFTETLGAEHE